MTTWEKMTDGLMMLTLAIMICLVASCGTELAHITVLKKAEQRANICAVHDGAFGFYPRQWGRCDRNLFGMLVARPL